MSSTTDSGPSRREVLETAGTVAAASVLAGVAIPHVHASSSEEIKVALVGCGGRGTGAASNALSVKTGPTKLVAMADVFPDRLDGSFGALKQTFDKKMDVPDDRKFLGFDAYKKAMDSLRPGDVVILATPPAFRWVQFSYAIQKGLNVFMEKPTTVDGPSSRKMLKLAEESEKRGLKVGVGLMCRHCEARRELHDRIKGGQIGDIILMRAYRMAGPTGSAFSTPRPEKTPELHYQIRRFHSFLWASGGAFSDFLIHNIDESCWMKDAWPVKAQGMGGRHYKQDRGGQDYVDQNFDAYSVEYTFADGSKLLMEGRTMAGCHQEFASYAHGAKGSAIISTSSHWPAKSRIFKGQNMVAKDVAWQFPQPEPEALNPYQLEWEHLTEAIRQGKPYNEAKRGAEASLVTAMGRMACHTGRIITYEEALNHDHEFAPDVDKLTLDGEAPLKANEKGRYPIPRPGVQTKREY